MRLTIAAALTISVGMSGCAMTGLDAQKTFTCKAPAGIGCSSLSGVYANAVADNLPGSPNKTSSTQKKKTYGGSLVVGEAPANGMPILSEPKVLRVWVAPWEDNHKVLHDQAFLYAVADPGHWQIAHSKRQIANEYRVLEPAVKQSTDKPQPEKQLPQYQIPQPQVEQ